MIAVDTNVLVRYFVNDDRRQAARARALIEEALGQGDQIYVGLVVLVELLWVLEYLYGFTRKEIADVASDILSRSCFHVQNRDPVEHALKAFSRGKADFSDYVSTFLAGQFSNCPLHTFDKKCKEPDLFVRLGRR